MCWRGFFWVAVGIPWLTILRRETKLREQKCLCISSAVWCREETRAWPYPSLPIHQRPCKCSLALHPSAPHWLSWRKFTTGTLVLMFWVLVCILDNKHLSGNPSFKTIQSVKHNGIWRSKRGTQGLHLGSGWVSWILWCSPHYRGWPSVLGHAKNLHPSLSFCWMSILN